VGDNWLFFLARILGRVQNDLYNYGHVVRRVHQIENGELLKRHVDRRWEKSFV